MLSLRPQGGTAWTRFIMQRSQTTQQHLLKHMYSTAWRWEIISNLEPENLPFSLNLIWIHQPSESSTTERPQCLLCGGGAGCRRSVLLMCSHMMCILISLKLLQDSCHFLWSRGSNLLKREDEEGGRGGEQRGRYTETKIKVITFLGPLWSTSPSSKSSWKWAKKIGQQPEHE